MVDVTFREAPPPAVEQPKPNIPEPEPVKERVGEGEADGDLVEFRDTGGRSVVLDALNINEDVNNLPEKDRGDIKEVKDYVLELVEAKGLAPTVASFRKTLDGLKGEMGLDKEADPAVVLDRVAGVVKAWRNLSFVKDTEEKKSIFFKLANLKSSADMNREVFKMMEDYKIWS